MRRSSWKSEGAGFPRTEGGTLSVWYTLNTTYLSYLLLLLLLYENTSERSVEYNTAHTYNTYLLTYSVLVIPMKIAASERSERGGSQAGDEITRAGWFKTFYLLAFFVALGVYLWMAKTRAATNNAEVGVRHNRVVRPGEESWSGSSY